MTILKITFAPIVSVGLVLFANAGLAQDYPSQPITWIAPSTPGGGFDIVSRLIAPKMSEIMGQPVVVQNIAGAGGTIGAAAAAEANPDGYTILLANANLTAAEALYDDLKYNFLTDFDLVVRFTDIRHLIVVHPSVPAQSLSELIALAKENPGEMNIASAGIGSPAHMCAELFKVSADIDITTIPYEGGTQGLASVVAGETNVYCPLFTTAKPYIEEGRLRALAVTSNERASFLPDVPAASEALPDFEFLGWFGLVVPKGTPLDVRETIRNALVESLTDPTVNQRLLDLGMAPINQGPEEFGAFVEKEVNTAKSLVENAGI